MRRRILALGGIAVLAVASCSGRSHQADPTTTPPPSTVAAPDPYVIPAVITPAYVNAVFKVLNHVNGDAVRELLHAHTVDSIVQRDIRAIYSDSLYAEELKIANESLRTSMTNVRSPLGDRVTTVRNLIVATHTCIFVSTATDLSAVLIDPPAAAKSEYYRLSANRVTNNLSSPNRTPWVISFNATYETPTTIPDQCVGS